MYKRLRLYCLIHSLDNMFLCNWKQSCFCCDEVAWENYSQTNVTVQAVKVFYKNHPITGPLFVNWNVMVNSIHFLRVDFCPCCLHNGTDTDWAVAYFSTFPTDSVLTTDWAHLNNPSLSCCVVFYYFILVLWKQTNVSQLKEHKWTHWLFNKLWN